MSVHLFVHYLDLLRHELASTFTWEAVKTNIGAGPYWAGIAGFFSYIFVPRFRDWVNGHFRSLHEARALSDDALHAKLDHIIKHHPDIPKFTPVPKRDAKGHFVKRNT